jgi:hypothetical protein
VAAVDLSVREYGRLVSSLYERRTALGLLRHPNLVVYRLSGRSRRGAFLALHPLTDEESAAWHVSGSDGRRALMAAAAARCGYPAGWVWVDVDQTGAVTGPWVAEARRR